MSTTDSSVKQWRDSLSPEERARLGSIRRMPVTLSAEVTWQLAGHLLIDSRTRETVKAEVFSGIGFYARPKAGQRAEAVVVFPGGDASNPLIIATRNEDARAAVAEIEEDETVAFNSLTVILVKADGTVEIRRSNTAAAPLLTLDDGNRLKSAIQGWTPVPNDGGAALKTALTTLFATWPTGTTVLKAQ